MLGRCFPCLPLLAGALLLRPAAVAGQARENGAGQVTVGAAANLTDVFRQAGREFEAQTGIHPVFSFASTAQLAQQIENGAPYDAFAAADSEHVAKLEKENLLQPGSRAVYATGVLALWIPASSHAKVNRIEDLVSPDVKVIAAANPQLAPYGEATIQTLQHLGILDQVKSRIVYAPNINVARQYGTSGNADAVFTAYSLVLKESGKVMRVSEDLHRPIRQELGIVKNSAHLAEARRFTDFLLHGRGKQILASFGYQVR